MSGAAIIGLSVWSLLYKHQYVALLASSNYQFCTYALLLAGIGSVLSAIIGCCGVKRESFSIILIVSFETFKVNYEITRLIIGLSIHLSIKTFPSSTKIARKQKC